MNRCTIVRVAFAAGSLLLASCGESHDDHSAVEMPAIDGSDGHADKGHGAGHDDTTSVVGADAREVAVTAANFAFDPAEIAADVGEDLAIVLTSGDMVHDFVIDELDVHVAADRGEAATAGLAADEPGTYTYYCSVPGHRRAGMEGTMTVRSPR